MSKFKEELVINALHADKVVIGKRYLFADDILELKNLVESNPKLGRTLTVVAGNKFCYLDSLKEPVGYSLVYPYEEPPKKRMSNIQFLEWLAKGNGLCSVKGASVALCVRCCLIDDLNAEVETNILIRPWNSSDWIVPTVDIYERDCKGGKE